MGNSICRIVQMYNREWGLSTEDYPGNPMSKLLSSSGKGQVPGPRTKDKDLNLGYTLNLVCYHPPSHHQQTFLWHKSLQTITV